MSSGGAQAWDVSAMDSDRHSELAGYGFGLPLARLYARHLNGGDLTLTSTPGIGVTATVRLRDLSALMRPEQAAHVRSGVVSGDVPLSLSQGEHRNILPVGVAAQLGFETLVQAV